MKTHAAVLIASLTSLLAACGQADRWDGDGFDDAGAAEGDTDGEYGGEGEGDGGAGEGGGEGGGDGGGDGEDGDGHLRTCEDGDCGGDDDGGKPDRTIVVPGGGEDGGCLDGGDGGELQCRPVEAVLVAGQQYEAGWVEVGTTEQGLRIEIDTIGPWTLKQVHVFAGVDVPGSNPGSYPFAEALDSAVDYDSTIPFDALEAQCGEVILVAVHAEVSKPGDGEQCQEETAWAKAGGEHDHDLELGWGGYFEVTLCCD